MNPKIMQGTNQQKNPKIMQGINQKNNPKIMHNPFAYL